MRLWHVEIWVSKELSVAWSPKWQQERDVSICFADFEVIRVQTYELGNQVPNCGGWKVLGFGKDRAPWLVVVVVVGKWEAGAIQPR